MVMFSCPIFLSGKTIIINHPGRGNNSTKQFLQCLNNALIKAICDPKMTNKKKMLPVFRYTSF